MVTFNECNYAYDRSLISPDTAFERPSSVVDAYINPQNNGKGGTADIVPSDFQELSKDKVNLKFGSNIDKTVIYGEVTKAVVKKPTTSTTTTDKEKQEKEKQEKERQEKEKQEAAKQEAAKQQELDRKKKEKERLEKERQKEIERQKELERQRKQNANSNKRN